MKALVNLIQKFSLRNLWRVCTLIFKNSSAHQAASVLLQVQADEGKRKGHRRSYMTSAIDIWHWFSLWDKQLKCCLSPWSAVVSSALCPGYNWNHTAHTWHRWQTLQFIIYFLTSLQLLFWGESRPHNLLVGSHCHSRPSAWDGGLHKMSATWLLL